MTLADAILGWLAHEMARRLPAFFPILAAPPKPGRFTLSILGAASMTKYTVQATVPAKTADDVAKFVLAYTVNGQGDFKAESTGDPITFDAALGDVISATFTEVDAAGNASEPSDPVTLTVTDSIAPGKPGTFGLAVTGQVDVPDPAPTPAPAPTS